MAQSGNDNGRALTLCHLHNHLADRADTEYHADIARLYIALLDSSMYAARKRFGERGTQQRYVIRQDVNAFLSADQILSPSSR